MPSPGIPLLTPLLPAQAPEVTEGILGNDAGDMMKFLFDTAKKADDTDVERYGEAEGVGGRRGDSAAA